MPAEFALIGVTPNTVSRPVVSGFFAEQPAHRNFEAFSNGCDFVVHQVASLAFNARNGSLIENYSTRGHASGEVVLRHGGRAS